MDTAARSQWSNPVMWLVVGLPLVSMVFGIGLVVIADRDADDAIVDKVDRTGQMQVANLDADSRAKQLRLGAVMRFTGDAVQVIPVQGAFDRHAPLRLSLLHPAHSAADRVVIVQPDALGWHAASTVDARQEWNVRLEPMDAHWRISGRLPRGQHAVALQPAMQDPG
ncbi:FixH family protein [Cognatilysobacter lacus]|uniref:Nitrogen fixation protein FixH n=1 Tax=Cognatilysobacter lacus TaxID=1643323 RepID=A0A5D8Z8R9_9GAMM|nr:FixH family protein [Lysobacter lacus]TZF90522.1 nitrogen fixation protein FixH [Lysobacter lacus]